MEQALKQRLVGAAVIIAVGVIVIPVLLNGAGERQLRKMPDAPSPTYTSRPGMVAEEKISGSGNKNTARIVLTLPDIESESALDKKEKSKPDTTASKAVPVPTLKNKQSDKPEPAKAKSTTDKAVATVAIKEPPKKAAKELAKKPTITTKPIPPVTEKSTIRRSQDGVWVVQVGSFTDAKKAFQFRDKLRKKKHKAFIEKISGRSGQSLYRVRVGPLPSRDKADGLSAKLKRDGIEGFVTRHP